MVRVLWSLRSGRQSSSRISGRRRCNLSNGSPQSRYRLSLTSPLFISCWSTSRDCDCRWRGEQNPRDGESDRRCCLAPSNCPRSLRRGCRYSCVALKGCQRLSLLRVVMSTAVWKEEEQQRAWGGGCGGPQRRGRDVG